MIRKSIVFFLFLLISFVCQAQLTIHVINVGQGNCLFIEGPEVDGKRKTMIFDGGKKERGHEIVDYLEKLGYKPQETVIDYMVVSHKDADHFEGFTELLGAGYRVGSFYDNGSKKKQPYYDLTFIPLVQKTSDKQYVMKPGYKFDLGDGATVTCVISGGQILGEEPQNNLSENDKSIGLLFKYVDFEFLSAGDLGGGSSAKDAECTHRVTSQDNLETPLLRALRMNNLIDRKNGIEVLHVSHHGSESSTNHEFMNGLSPSVAVISVGVNQSSSYSHPRKDIVERVLMGSGPCITVEPAMVYQTEDGLNTAKTSRSGYAVGDIIIDIFKKGEYTISATGKLNSGDFGDIAASGLPKTFKVDK